MFTDDIRGLTLLRPWPYTFVNGKTMKRIENRTWTPPTRYTRKDAPDTLWLALHAGKGWDKPNETLISSILFSQPDTGERILKNHNHADSQIFAVCRVEKVVGFYKGSHKFFIGLAKKETEQRDLEFWTPQTIPADWQKQTETWGFGPYCWLLTDFQILYRPITGIPGGQGLWRISERPGLIDELKDMYLYSKNGL